MSFEVLRLQARSHMTEAQWARTERRLLANRAANARARYSTAQTPEAAANASQVVHDALKAIAGLQRFGAKTLRPGARAVHLARMFLNGVELKRVERFCYEPPNWDLVESILREEFSEEDWTKEHQQRFQGWMSDHVVIPHRLRDARKHAPSDKIAKALAIAKRHGTTGPPEQRTWVIDQMVRALIGYDSNYDEFVNTSVKRTGAIWGRGLHP